MPERPVSAQPMRVVRERWRGADLLSYPERPRTIVDVLDRAVTDHPDATAFVDRADRCTYRQFADRVAGAVAALRERSVAAGTPVGVAADNAIDVAVVLFACAAAGAVMVGLPPRNAAPRWARLLHTAGAELVLADSTNGEVARAAVDQLPRARVLPLATIARAPSRPWNAPVVDEADTFAVVGTAGTTGAPKASRVIHRCSVHSAMSYRDVISACASDRTAVLFPLTYISALHAHVLPMMLVGGTSVLTADGRPAAFTRLLARERITWMYTVPSLWFALLRGERFDGRQLPRLRAAAFGGAPFPPDVVADIRRRLPDVALHNVYGLSETHSPATILRDAEFAQRPQSVGRPLPCMEARVVDVDGRSVPADTTGELQLRGSLVTSGYLGDADATAAAFDGAWLRTGDHARMDAQGYVSILGRRGDLIIRRGTNIAPVEVEQALRRMPGVADVAVYGVPEPMGHEAVACTVVADGPVTVDDVRQWVRAQIADVAVPRDVAFSDALPLTPIGKLDRGRLRAAATGNAADRRNGEEHG